MFIRRISAPPQVAPQEPGISSVTHGTPLISPGRRGIGLHPDLGKCLQFFLSELRALCPPIRFLRGTGCSLRLGIQPSSVEREGFPHLGSSVLLPSRNPPFRMVPRLFRSALFPGRVSLPLGSPVCPARLIPLRCIWVMSPQFGDRQLLQGMTSEMNSKPICRGFCCVSVVGKASV